MLIIVSANKLQTCLIGKSLHHNQINNYDKLEIYINANTPGTWHTFINLVGWTMIAYVPIRNICVIEEEQMIKSWVVGIYEIWVGSSLELTVIDEIKVNTNHVVSQGLEKFKLSSFSWQLNETLRTYNAQWYNLDDLGLFYRKKPKQNTTRNQNEMPQKTKIQFVGTLKMTTFADENQ